MRLLSSLTNRIFLASALLAVTSIAVAVYVVNVAVTTQAEAELRRGLEEAGTLVDQYRALLFENFTRQARLIADLPRLKAAVGEDHPPTAQPVAEEYRGQINADLFLVTNRNGRVLAAVGQSNIRDSNVANLAAVRNALAGRETTSFWPRAGGVLQVVSVPIWIGLDQPEMLGTLTVGFNLDQPLAMRLRRLTDSEIAFAVDGKVQAATLPGIHQAALETLLRSDDISTVTLGGDQYVAVTRPLAPRGVTGIGAPAARVGVSTDPAHVPIAVILRSRTARLRFLGPVHRALGATALVAVLAATLLSYLVARSVTQPLGALSVTMREMAATGDLTRKLVLPPSKYWDDEDARLLANTFNAMTESIARFQHEAAQRERLSSLGRLSTVVAHEIRNPLMIIKTSLRPLGRPGITDEQVRAAVADIDEEITRLNRIVTEVLDFARPIRFEYAATDVIALCEAAAAAAAAGNAWPPVAVRLDSRLPEIVTDAERLRQALVNILANARQAVAAHAAAEIDDQDHAPVARPGNRGTEPEIELVTEALGNRLVAITVSDRGVGIALEDLGRVFDPYFTTRRTGTGLGLAIAKNIVEGLGGSISARRRAGNGTEIRVELRSQPLQEARQGAVQTGVITA